MPTFWKLKSTLPCFFLGDRIQIGDDFKVILDKNGLINQLLTLADGTKTVDELGRLMSTEQITITPSEIEDRCQKLAEMGWMENVSLHHPSQLPELLRERFKVNINFFSHRTLNQDPYLYQDKLRKSKVTLLGLGGGGSNLLMNLAALGVQDIIGVDFDKVELSNLNRQPLYTPEDVGKYKVDAAAKWIERFYPESNFHAKSMAVKSVEDVISITENRDLLIVAADEPVVEMRKWVNEASVITKVPFIIGGIQSHSAHYEMIKLGVTPCWECIQTGIREQDSQWNELVDIVSKSRYRSQSVIMPYMGILTSYIASDALNYLTGIEVPWSMGKKVSINFINGGVTIHDEWKRDPNCSVCNSIKQEVF